MGFLKNELMETPKHILFITQEMCPFTPEETPLGMLNRRLPEYFQSHGYETRTFMPKLGEINERRNQLHEVIRLSGANLIINDADHPLLIKVASIPSARMQIYFIDNDDYFTRRKGYEDEGGEYPDNDERTIFFGRGVLETMRKLRWTPDIIHCSGWMAALIPLYIKRAYADTLFFKDSKIVLALDGNEYQKPFPSAFSEKLLINGVSTNDIRSIAGFSVGYEELMRLAIEYSDAFVINSNKVSPRLLNYVDTQQKPVINLTNCDPESYQAFYDDLVAVKEE